MDIRQQVVDLLQGPRRQRMRRGPHMVGKMRNEGAHLLHLRLRRIRHQGGDNALQCNQATANQVPLSRCGLKAR